MPALLVLNYDVHDQEALDDYRQKAADVILGASGRVVTSTDSTIALGETPTPAGTHTVILSYRSTEEASRRYESKDYAQLIDERIAATSPRAAFIVDVTNPQH